MTTHAEVRLWGTTIGAVMLEDGQSVATFEYAPDFLRSGIEVASCTMPLDSRLYRFPELASGSFHGLPGLLADSLPDRFGNAVIDTWLSQQGRDPATFNAVERLCYTSTRGMGALEFAPARGPVADHTEQVQIADLVQLASRILSSREALQTSLTEPEPAVRQILQVGTSAGGARAKAVLAWNPTTEEVRSGQVDVAAGFEHWLLKFDGVQGNRDRELEDPQGYGRIEYAYHLMARQAGILMEDCRLLEEGGRSHFMTRRFDRTRDGNKLHMQSLGALAHFDFNQVGAHGYEQVFQLMRRIELPMEQLEQQFLRMVFNLVARNQDDHVKNIAFLMDRAGRWSLAPAFDVVFSYNPSGPWTSQHQMSVQGKRDGFAFEDLVACAAGAGLRRGFAKDSLERILTSVASWSAHAAQAGVEQERQEWIAASHRMEWPRSG